MTETHVVSALKLKRAQVAGQIIAAERQITDLRAALVHLDGALKLFAGEDVNPEAIPARMPRPQIAFKPHRARGDLTRTILDVLRNAPYALSANEVVVRVASTLSVAYSADDRHDPLAEGVRTALYRQRDRGTILNMKDGTRVLWQIAELPDAGDYAA